MTDLLVYFTTDLLFSVRNFLVSFPVYVTMLTIVN